MLEIIKKKTYKYFHTLLDFYKLSNYVKVSTKFFNHLEATLGSDLSNNYKIELIKGIYSNFKVDLNLDDFVEGIPNQNKFDI